MKTFLRFFFHHLYHSLAWGYDLVAWTVSLGRWRDWCAAVIPHLPGGRILEVGSGPGHLAAKIASHGRCITGLDESWQMNCLAKRRYPTSKLLRSRAECTPFAAGSYEVLLATFPAPYLFTAPAAAEFDRILAPGGQMVALLAARPNQRTLAGWLIRVLFQITGETPSANLEETGILNAYCALGFSVALEWITHPTADLLLMRCRK